MSDILLVFLVVIHRQTSPACAVFCSSEVMGRGGKTQGTLPSIDGAVGSRLIREVSRGRHNVT